jgi:hypothetical protein
MGFRVYVSVRAITRECVRVCVLVFVWMCVSARASTKNEKKVRTQQNILIFPP